MVLNYIWIAFFLIAFVVAIIKTIGGDTEVFSAIVNSTFDLASTSFEISIGLTGVLCLWLGIMNIGEKGGAIQIMSKLVGPFFSKLFPGVPENHPARGAMLMNFSANMLGLDNAATPMGLKAMKELQELNPKKDTASDAQIMFLVLNTSGLTLIPITVMNYRSQFGAENPSDVFIPILIATFFASLVGLITVAIYQKINLFNKVVLAYMGGITTLIVGMIFYFSSLTPEELKTQSSLISNIILFTIIISFIIMAMRKKINVYDAFVEGAKGGFDIAVKIIPFLVAILVSIGVFRASGAMNLLTDAIAYVFALFLDDVEFVYGLPTALMKPLSGSGARGLMLESFDYYGVDSFVGKLTSTLQGATDTTFYIIAVYFGAVNIKNTRYAIKAGLLADFAGIVAGILVAYLFFGTTKDTLTAEQTIAQYTDNWIQNNVKANEELLADDIYMFNSRYDTLATDKNDFINNILVKDTLKTPRKKVQLIKPIGSKKDKKILVKIKEEGKQETQNYLFEVKNGKIKAVEKL